MRYACKECGTGLCEACVPAYRFRYKSYLQFKMWQIENYRALKDAYRAELKKRRAPEAATGS